MTEQEQNINQKSHYETLLKRFKLALSIEAVSTGTIVLTTPFINSPTAQHLLVVEGAALFVSAVVARRLSNYVEDAKNLDE